MTTRSCFMTVVRRCGTTTDRARRVHDARFEAVRQVFALVTVMMLGGCQAMVTRDAQPPGDSIAGEKSITPAASGHKSPIPSAAAPVEGTQSCAIPARPAASGPYRAEFEQLDRARDINQLAVWREQAQQQGQSTRKYVRSPQLAQSRFTTVRAFTYRFTESRDPVLDDALPGCGDAILSETGQPCPSTVLPGVRLRTDQVERFVSLLHAPALSYRMRCGYDPHHAFVFYDANDQPVFDVSVCFSCNEWSISGASQVPMPDPDAVEELCRELGLLGCPVPEQQRDAFYENWRHWRRSGAPPRPSTSLNIPPDTPMNALNAEQRRKLCAWRLTETGGAKGRWVSGSTFRIQSYTECVDSFPICDVPLGKLEEAMLHDYYEGPTLADQCTVDWVFGPLGHCLWGIAERCPAPEAASATSPAIDWWEPFVTQAQHVAAAPLRETRSPHVAIQVYAATSNDPTSKAHHTVRGQYQRCFETASAPEPSLAGHWVAEVWHTDAGVCTAQTLQSTLPRDLQDCLRRAVLDVPAAAPVGRHQVVVSLHWPSQ